MTSSSPAAGRGSLSVSLIIDTAVKLVDADGLAALSMRRLGAALNVEAMALYHYVANREQLLDSMVNKVIDDLASDPELTLTDDGWEDYLTRIAHGVRRIANTHPQLFPLVVTRPPEAPWLRPPLRSISWLNAYLCALGDCGFSDAQAVETYRAFSSFLVGHLLIDVSAQGVDLGGAAADAAPAGAAPELDLSEYPKVAELAPALADYSPDAEFGVALDAFLSRTAEVLRKPPAKASPAA